MRSRNWQYGLLWSRSVPGSTSTRTLLLLAVASALASSPVRAAPPQDESSVAIPPGREAPARDLLAPLLGERDDDLSLLGPSIERDRIKWWLMRGDQSRALLLLVPHIAGEPDDPRSKSFAMQIAPAPGVELEPAEQALLDQAIATVQARDQGGFYVLLVDTLLERDEPVPAGPHSRPIADDPDPVRRWWALKVAAVGLLAGVAAATTLRPRREPAGDHDGSTNRE